MRSSLPSWKVMLGSVPSRSAAEPVTGSSQAEIPLEFGVLGNGICKKGGVKTLPSLQLQWSA